jgi:hypothetical protein
VSLVITPSARETFTPWELVGAYKEYTKHGPQNQDAEGGVKAAAYRFGERVLLVYEEPETGMAVLIHPSAWNRNSRKFSHFDLLKCPSCPARLSAQWH